jgi:hypothetical protein
MHLHSDGLRLTIEEDEESAIIGIAVDSDRPMPIRQGVELALGFIHRSLQQLLGKSWRSQAVCFTHAPPARKDAHRRFFGTNVEFGHDCNAIVCLAADITLDAIPIHWRRAPTRRCETMLANVSKPCCLPVCAQRIEWRSIWESTVAPCIATWRGTVRPFRS